MGIMDFFRNKKKENDCDSKCAQSLKADDVSKVNVDELSIEDLMSRLPIKQKYAFMAMIFYFQGFCIESPKTSLINRAVGQMADILNVSIQESMNYAEKNYNSVRTLTQELKSLPKRAKSVLLSTCCILCVFDTKGGSDDAACTIFNELGFTTQEISLVAMEKISKFGF